VTDPTAAEAEVEAVRAAEADQWRAEADAAAEEMAAQLSAHLMPNVLVPPVPVRASVRFRQHRPAQLANG
jgi:hypothetical protein